MTTLADRMKAYEACYDFSLPKRSYIIVRLDGKAFHTYTKGFEKPFSEDLNNAFAYAVGNFMEEFSNVKLTYHQSDEVSFLLTDFDKLETESLFNNRLSKLLSLFSSCFTAHFNLYCALLQRDLDFTFKLALFDARAFVLPEPNEVFNYFYWRFRDCYTNSVSSLAQANFSHKQLHGLNINQLQEKLFQEKNINYYEQPEPFKNGTFFFREESVLKRVNYKLLLDENKIKLFSKIPLHQVYDYKDRLIKE